MAINFESASDLAHALRHAAEAHRRYETETGRADPDWPTWYAAYLERYRAGDGDGAAPHRAPVVTVKGLPGRVDPKDLTVTQPVEPPPDPEGGRDTETDFLFRYGAGG